MRINMQYAYPGLLSYLGEEPRRVFYEARGKEFLDCWVATLLGVNRVWLDLRAGTRPEELVFTSPEGKVVVLIFPPGTHAEELYHRLTAAICSQPHIEYLPEDWSVAVYTATDVLRVLPESLDELVERFGGEPDYEVIRL